MERLLLFSGIGAFGLLSLLIDYSGLLPGGRNARVRGRRLAKVLLILHGPLAAVLLVGRVAAFPLFARPFVQGDLTTPADEDAPGQTYVFVNGHEFPVAYINIIRQLDRPAVAPRRVALLSSVANENSVYREDLDTLVITARHGFLRAPVDRLMRDVNLPFRIGERIERRDFTAEVRTVTADGRPQEVSFHFRAPLESGELRWFSWGERGTQAFALPQVGERVELPKVSLLSGFVPQ